MIAYWVSLVLLILAIYFKLTGAYGVPSKVNLSELGWAFALAAVAVWVFGR